MLQQAIEASVKTASTNEADDDDDEELQRVIALSRQDVSCCSGAWSFTFYRDEHLEPPPPELFEWHEDLQ